jgi:hypothetical protein
VIGLGQVREAVDGVDAGARRAAVGLGERLARERPAALVAKRLAWRTDRPSSATSTPRSKRPVIRTSPSLIVCISAGSGDGALAPSVGPGPTDRDRRKSGHRKPGAAAD